MYIFENIGNNKNKKGDFMSERRLYQIIISIITIILLGFGIYMGIKITKNNDNSTAQVINKNDDTYTNTVAVYTDANDKKTDIQLIYEDYYTLDDKVESNSNMVYGISINDLKKQEVEKNKQKNNGYELVEQTSVKLRFRRTLEQYSPNHFLVKLVDGKVVIYSIVSDSVNTVYKETNISELSLRPELLEELNIGKRVDSKDELNQLIEDIES